MVYANLENWFGSQLVICIEPSFVCLFFLSLCLKLCFFFRFEDPGPHGNGRYSEHMSPEIDKKDFRKGAQV